MNKNRFFSHLLIVFYLIIFTVPAYWLLRDHHQPAWSLMEYRYLSEFPKFPMQRLRSSAKQIVELNQPMAAMVALSQQLQEDDYPGLIEIAASDLFPMRPVWIQFSHGFDRLMIRMGYMFTEDPAIPARMSMTGYKIFETREAIPSLFYYPSGYRTNNLENINETIENYRALIQAYPNINFYVYNLELIAQSIANPLNSQLSSPVSGQYTDYFVSQIPDQLNFEAFRLHSFEDQQRYFFRTDHHWNIHGSLYAYDALYKMLKTNYPGISPELPLDQLYVFPDIRFQGSMARRTAYQVQPADSFEVAMIDFPPYRILDIDGNELNLNSMDEYFAGTYSTKPFTDHYVEFYGPDTVFHEYIFENGTDRNLLIIGDSYVNSIEMLLASHYHHTYVADIRNFPDNTLSLSDFLADNPVDDILFLGGPSQTIMHEWTITP